MYGNFRKYSSQSWILFRQLSRLWRGQVGQPSIRIMKRSCWAWITLVLSQGEECPCVGKHPITVDSLDESTKFYTKIVDTQLEVGYRREITYCPTSSHLDLIPRIADIIDATSIMQSSSASTYYRFAPECVLDFQIRPHLNRAEQ